jgi:hypothetical protein
LCLFVLIDERFLDFFLPVATFFGVLLVEVHGGGSGFSDPCVNEQDFACIARQRRRFGRSKSAAFDRIPLHHVRRVLLCHHPDLQVTMSLAKWLCQVN